jgi:hypothetical protein
MDNPRKKKADGKRVSHQTHEQAYQKKKSLGTKSDSRHSRSEPASGSKGKKS